MKQQGSVGASGTGSQERSWTLSWPPCCPLFSPQLALLLPAMTTSNLFPFLQMSDASSSPFTISKHFLPQNL